jgi:hypothetical protein
MKLKEFNTENVEKSRRGQASIRLTKSGMISISKELGELLQLKVGDKLALSQNEDKPKDWYLNVSPIGFAIRNDSKNEKEKNRFAFNCSSLVQKLFDSIGYEGSSIAFLVSEEAEKISKVSYYAILTAGYRPKEND